MNWEQKLLALKALGGSNTSLHIRGEGNWYVRVPGVEIKDRSLLQSVSGDGSTPQAAIEDCWDNISGRTLIVRATSAERSAYLWNGFMWECMDKEA